SRGQSNGSSPRRGAGARSSLYGWTSRVRGESGARRRCMGALGSDAHLRHRPNAKPAVDLAARWQAQPGRSGDLDGLGTMTRKTGITIDNAPASGVGGRVPPPAVWRGRIAVKSGTAR